MLTTLLIIISNNPSVLGTATKLISKELSDLGIQLPYTTQASLSVADTSNQSMMQLHPVSAPPDAFSFIPYDETALLDNFYLNGEAAGAMSYNLLDMPPEMYEAFSQIEPLSVTMDAGFDLF